MFSEKTFIQASRDFVCVRLESYESKEHQDMVRSFLGGRFENTAFCLLAPDGKERLSGSGRSPAMGLSRGGGGPRGPRPGPGGPGGPPEDGKSREQVIAAMKKVSAKFPVTGKVAETVVEDFHTFHQALNVASGDQRLLVLTTGKTTHSLAPVFSDPAVVGRFHWDAAGKKDAEWNTVIEGEKSTSGIFIIQADTFGQKGKVLAELPLAAKPETVKAALAKANQQFAAGETRKVYREHVAEGRRQGIQFVTGVEYGEDRDGDGKIDGPGSGRPGPGGAGPGGPKP